jgi:hypothetical protein
MLHFPLKTPSKTNLTLSDRTCEVFLVDVFGLAEPRLETPKFEVKTPKSSKFGESQSSQPSGESGKGLLVPELTHKTPTNSGL